jgi:hypothetical protein
VSFSLRSPHKAELFGKNYHSILGLEDFLRPRLSPARSGIHPHPLDTPQAPTNGQANPSEPVFAKLYAC